MLTKIKKFYSFIFAVLLSFCALHFVDINASAKVRGDCIFSVGPACRPAQWLRKTHKRFQAAPFDWMMKYSLDTVIHCFQNKFSDFFESAEATGEIIGNERVVRDTKNGIVSMHHFSKNLSLEDAKKDVREKMIRRGKKVDQILKKSKSIILIANRQKDSFDDFKRFINNFSKLYPDRNIALINIRSNGSNNVTKDVLYETVAATSEKKNKKHIKNQNGDKNKKAATNSEDKSAKTKNKTQPKKPIKKRRKKIKIIQYSFNDASSSWEGNPSGWQQVMDDIELTDKLFDKNMDFKTVEF